MNSMIRQHHLRLADIKAYLRAFERNKPLSPDEWASKESAQYEPGHLLFCLETVAAPSGLSSFSKKTGEDQGETYRVKHLCAVISRDDDKPVAVIVSASAYEFRVLDSLLLEQAMKAILDGRDFNYLAARPTQKLDDSAVKALYKLGSEYAKGGSRRALMSDGSQLQEPAIAILGQLGAKLGAQLGKQLLDITSVCHMIFTPEGKVEDKNKTLLKSCFVPMRSEEEPAAPAVKADMGDSRYSIDPLSGGANLEEKYSSEAGNIDLSHLAPQQEEQNSYMSPFARPAEPAAEAISPFARPAEPAGEPSSSFGDFGMGLLSALAPQTPPGPAGETAAPPVPPAAPGASQANMPSAAPAAGPGASQTNLPPVAPFASGPGASQTNIPAAPAPWAPGASQTNMPAQPPAAQFAGGPGASQTNMPAANVPPPGTASYANLPSVGGNGHGPAAAPEWFVMSHQAVPAKPAAPPVPPAFAGGPGASQTNIPSFNPAAPGASQTNLASQAPAAAPGPTVSQTNLASQAPAAAPGPTVSQTNLASQAPPVPPAAAPGPTVSQTNLAGQAPAEAKADYSQQFMDDWKDGKAGSRAADDAEKEFVKEKEMKAVRDAGKEQRLREYFGDEHYQKYVKGEIPEPEIAKLNSWQLDPSQYKAEPAEGGPNFDADIFANAGRGTLETNPEGTVIEPPREEITGPPPDPSWAIPPILAPEEKKTDSSFDSMLSAGGELPVPEKVRPLEQPTGDQPMPNLSILDGLAAEAGAAQTAEPPELGPLAVPADSPSQGSSLFDRLTGELAPKSPTTSQSNLTAVPPAASEPAPQTVNWSPPVAADEPEINTSGANWPTIPPSESLFAQPADDEISSADEPAVAVPKPVPTPEAVAPEPPVAATPQPVAATPETMAAPPEPIAAAPEPVAAAEPAVSPEPTAAFEPAVAEPLSAEPAAADVDAASSEDKPGRVRPRDYSSPLRPPKKSLGGGDSPLRPAAGSRQNMPPSLTSSQHSALEQPAGGLQAEAPPVVEAAELVAEMPAPEPVMQQEPPQPVVETAPPEPVAQAAAPEPVVQSPLPEPVVQAPPVEETPLAATPPSSPFAPSAPVTPAAAEESPQAPSASEPPAQAPAAAVPTPGLSSEALPNLATLAAAQSGAAAGSQDARLMMNEMTSLMSKLDTQVSKAANKLASRAEEMRSRLSQQVDSIVKEAQEVEKQAENNLVSLASELKGKLDNLATEVQTNIVKEGMSSSQSMEELAQNGLEQLDSEQTQLSVEISRSTESFRKDLARLTSQVTGRLDNLIDSRNKELIALSDSILAQLKDTHDSFMSKATQRLDRFEQRMDEETASISHSLERNMRSMVEEIETSMERASDKLKQTKFELEQTVAHTIAVAELNIAQRAKQLLTETLLPRLNEQKEIIRTMIADMAKQIADESNASLDEEIAKLDKATSAASDKLKKVTIECIDEVESTGRSIKSGLEDHFKRASSDLMVRTREVGDKIRETERRMSESENALKSLAEASTVDSEPELNEERNHAVSKLASLKLEASKQLANSIEQNLEGLDSKGEELISELNNKRNELTSQVRDTAESNIHKIRQALQEATNAIRSAQEKHME